MKFSGEESRLPVVLCSICSDVTTVTSTYLAQGQVRGIRCSNTVPIGLPSRFSISQ